MAEAASARRKSEVGSRSSEEMEMSENCSSKAERPSSDAAADVSDNVGAPPPGEE